MLESKRLPREMILPRKALPEIEFKARRQTIFRPLPGRNGPGNWTISKEVESTDKLTNVIVSVVSRPVVAKDVILGEVVYPDSLGHIIQRPIFPWSPPLKVRLGIPVGKKIGRMMMRFRNNTRALPFSLSNNIEVKVISAKF